MAIDHTIIRNTENFKGLDKRSSDILRTREYATDIKNASYRITGAINKRKGFKKLVDVNQDCFGMTTFKNLNTSTGVITDQLIVAKEDNLFKVENDPITLTYSGLEENISFSCELDSTSLTFKFKIFDEGTEIFNQDLGTGEEVSPVTLTTLSTAMPTDFTLNVGTIGAKPAALMINTPRQVIGAGVSIDIDYYVETQLTKGDTSDTIFSHALGSEMQNVSFEQMNNVLYISNGIDHVMKYDGNKIYRAGLPGIVDDVIPGTWAYDEQNVITVETSTTGATIPQGTYHYKFLILYTDDKGNTITSQPSDPITITHSANSHIDVGWDLSIFDYLDKDPTKLKMCVYRTVKNAAVTDIYYKLHGDLPYNNDEGINLSTGEPVRFQDTIVLTGNTGAYDMLVNPIKRHDPPPKGSYLTKFKECLVIAGQSSNVNNVSYSLGFNAATSEIGSEYFPDDDNAFIVNSSFGTKITAIAPLRDLLYIFHEDSIHVLAGDISDPTGLPYTIDLLTSEGGLGCISFHSITEFQNNLVFLSSQGYFSINSSNALQEISSIINPIFNDKSLIKKRAITFNWTDKDLLLMIIPKEANNYTTSDSLIVVYDYFRGAWLQWDSLDFSAGISLSNDNLFFTSRKQSDRKISMFSDLGYSTDYADHASAINFEYDTNWESLGEPTVPKKFLRLKVHSFDTEQNFESPSFDVDIKIQKDYNDVDLGSINFNFGGQSQGGWGVAPWGSSGWGAVASKFVKSKLPTGKNKCMKLRFTNDTVNQNVLITNYEFEIAAPYRTEIKD